MSTSALPETRAPSRRRRRRASRHGGRQNRLDRIGPADFRRNQRGTAHAQGLLDCAQSAKTFLALLDLFDAYDRRADAADRSDPIVVADRLQQQDFSTEAPWRSNSRALSMPI